MSVVLLVLGVLSVLGGAAAIALGIPVKEFSFGNTLIESGTVGVVGGLIVVGLGAAIAQLHRIVEMLGARPLSRAGRGLEPFEVPARLGQDGERIPFPSRSKPEPKSEPKSELRPESKPAAMTDETRPQPAEPLVYPPTAEDRAEFEPELDLAPALHNPDVPLMAEEEAEELPLSPRTTFAAAPKFEPRSVEPSPSEPPLSEPPLSEPTISEPTISEPTWRSSAPRQERPSFDSMWPVQPRTPAMEPASNPAEPPASRAETIPRAGGTRMPEPQPQPELEPEPHYEPEPDVQPVAILKSGVVDGMGYTLYVDGSIEAELPDGTLRFASINELRAHLEKNS
jgi:hypothetical protein